ncbi:sortase [Lacticaseibacillus rhamnosus]|uniref:sortase n=1 Tax=Lacticaseibacillus rhamnosus TaxID=47715 RepID=UPI00386967DD
MVLRRENKDHQQKKKKIAANQQVAGGARFYPAVNDQRTAKTADKSKQKTFTPQKAGQMTIPKIGLSLSGFDHTSDWLLQFGACLLDGTSYPTGGKNTHAVISAHRGVPNAELFTRVPALKKGDKFFISIGNHKLAYQVFKRQVIKVTRSCPGTIISCRVSLGSITWRLKTW